MSPSKPQSRAFVRNAIYADSKPRKVRQEMTGIGFGNPSPALVHDKDVPHLEPPQPGYDSLFGAHLIQSQAGLRMVFTVGI
jgi:hypothetical protein